MKGLNSWVNSSICPLSDSLILMSALMKAVFCVQYMSGIIPCCLKGYFSLAGMCVDSYPASHIKKQHQCKDDILHTPSEFHRATYLEALESKKDLTYPDVWLIVVSHAASAHCRKQCRPWVACRSCHKQTNSCLSRKSYKLLKIAPTPRLKLLITVLVLYP